MSIAVCISVMVYVSGSCLILMSHDQMKRTKANESQVCLLVCNIHLQLSIGWSLCSQDRPRSDVVLIDESQVGVNRKLELWR
jgi:hypothetical protein